MIYNTDNYNDKEVEMLNRPKPCCICNTLTHFADFYTKLYVCSDECLKVLQNETDGIEEGELRW